MSEVIEKPAKKALKQYKITFHGEGAPVEIGHNFKLNTYPRNIETTIDENFLNSLKHSTITTVVQDADGKWQNVSLPTYQYSVEAL